MKYVTTKTNILDLDLCVDEEALRWMGLIFKFRYEFLSAIIENNGLPAIPSIEEMRMDADRGMT